MFNTFWLDKRFILYGDGGIHTVDELTDGYYTYFDFVDLNNKKLKKLPSPEDFINSLLSWSCDVIYKELIDGFLSQFYDPEKSQTILDEIVFYTIADTGKFISSFKVNGDKYYSVVKEYQFTNRNFSSRRYNLSLYRLEGKERFAYISDQTNFSRGECERSIRNCIKSRKPFDIRWYEVDLNV